MRNLLIGMLVGAATMAAVVPAQAIIGGSKATDQYSWIADLGHTDGGRGCGGGLIAPQWVVTAEHCLASATPGKPIRIGSNDRKSGGEVLVVDSTYKGDYGDIGLVKLAEPTKLAPLKVAPMPASGPIRLLGWGTDAHENPTPPTKLKQLDTEVLQAPCGGADEICVKVSADATACSGDSGTPALVGDAVVAVTSRGPIGQCGAEGWVIYTAVAPHQAWIEKTIAAN